jgi:ABC-2 type transport system permease protein
VTDRLPGEGAHVAKQPVWLVMRREIIERVRARSFLISTVIYLLVALASVIVPRLAAEREPVYRVGLTGAPAADLEQAIARLAPAGDLQLRTSRLPDREAAVAAVRARRVTVAVVDGTRLLARDDVPERLGLLVNTAAFQVQLGRRLASAGLGPAETAHLLSIDQLVVEEVQAERPARASNRPMAYAGVLVIYLLLLTYGFTVANGVLEEKSSRVSEVLLGALRPTQLLAGKVVGIGVVALLQLLLVGVPTGLVGLALGSLDLPSGTPLTVLAVVLWSLLGYGLYSCVFAAAGSAASRPEDVGNATAPITILIAATYFVAVASIQDPDGTLSRVASFIPFMTPMTMLPRAAVGHVAPWEVPLGIVLVLVSTYVTVRLGARIYAGGIRRAGPKLKLREAWRAAAA